MKRHTAIVAALLGLVTACGPDAGPAGRVVDKHSVYTGVGRLHTLTVRTADGEHTKVKVSRLDHRRCHRGSAYPACTRD
ncbi:MULTISPECIES: hypothetical protein [unclassified Streptomyces]|uniref:hypothetical protein n=1 Tax=unclassified Streptomyces TaxID=2593676 RepID=UPI000BF3BF03|nr:hypothetical protein [Streptomyces sp. Ru87]PGH52155.1 hypothetical protein CRI70_02800 [Streptomyces sp. Ru87]